ncbi:MAG: sugar phosphate nucleotidyltransferase, partial [Promethearchaeota archaeon]
MIALILVGGFGTRLRPLTCTRPKQLLPLGSSTLIEYMITRLANQGVKEIILAVGYRPDRLQNALGDGKDLGVTLHYSLEEKPLGTAGPIKQAEAYLRGKGEFLVLNGDIVSDMNYQQFLEQHRNKEATASIALYYVENPSRYGVVDRAADGRIRSFVEKPPAGSAPSNLINAGCYVLDESVLGYIPTGKRVSIEREIFPLLCENSDVFGWEHKGLWIDTGTPTSYLEANNAVLATALNETTETMISALSKDTSIHLTAPVFVGQGTTIGSSSDIGPNVTIGRDVIVGRNTQIRNTIIFDDAVISDGVVLEEVVIGQGAT